MKTTTLITAFIIISTGTFAQQKQTLKEETKTITYFEKIIIDGSKPNSIDAETKYENDYRVIVWNEPLIKSYKYSNEAFDKLGYELVEKNEGNDQQHSIVYRNCQKGITVEVTEWYKMKFSIAMQWYSPLVRNQIGNLVSCNQENINTKEIEYQLNKSAEEKRDKREKETEDDAKTHVFNLNTSNGFDVTYKNGGNNLQTIIEDQIKEIIKTKEAGIEEILFSGYLEVRIGKNGTIKGVSISPSDSKNNFISDLKLEKFSCKYSDLTYKGYPISNAIDNIKIDYSYKVKKQKFQFKDGELYQLEGDKMNKEKLEKIKNSIDKKKGLYNVTFIEDGYDTHGSFVEIINVKKKSKIVKILGETALGVAVIAIIAVLYL